MLASQGFSDHAIYAEVLIIELPEVEELVYDSSLLVPAAKLGHVTGILDHGEYVKVCC